MMPHRDREPPPDAARLQLLVLDCDGVLTDGSLIRDDQAGAEAKRFHVRDGFGVRSAQAMGLRVAVLSGRKSLAVRQRLKELRVELYLEGSDDKSAGLNDLLEKAGVDAASTAYMGDDILDMPAMRRCGYRLAPADAVEEVRHMADHLTQAAGGRGAVREAVEHLLKARGQWQAVVEKHGGGRQRGEDEEEGVRARRPGPGMDPAAPD